MQKLQSLQPRVKTLGASTESRKPWQKAQEAPKRRAGRWLQARNLRIKTRDQWTCSACGRISDELDVDHRIPLSQGGPDIDSNCQLLCSGPGNCHERKSIAERSEHVQYRTVSGNDQ